MFLFLSPLLSFAVMKTLINSFLFFFLNLLFVTLAFIHLNLQQAPAAATQNNAFGHHSC